MYRIVRNASGSRDARKLLIYRSTMDSAGSAMNNGLAIECDREQCREKSYAIYFCPLPTAASCISLCDSRKKRSEKQGDEEKLLFAARLVVTFFYFEKHHLTVCREDRSTTRAAPEQINEKSSRKTAERFFLMAAAGPKICEKRQMINDVKLVKEINGRMDGRLLCHRLLLES
jgi:hypothetical protein